MVIKEMERSRKKIDMEIQKEAKKKVLLISNHET